MTLMLKSEVGVMVRMLTKAGYKPETASTSGRTLVGNGVSLTPAKKLSEVDISEYVGVMIPCMAIGIGNGITNEGVAIVRDAAKKRMPIAAQTSGVEFLAKAGILKNRHFSIARGLEYVVPDGIYDGTDVTQDENIITASTYPYRATATTPGTTEKLTAVYIQALRSPVESN
jgi:protein deglycase